ncbi:hypothetical protein EDD21DRAFT_423781 [Dissophora ornata]|nr:hypothetical protein EDD21DRAFT_423781 [Dissophora ornata]
MCDDKLQELNVLVQDSIDSTKKESLEKFDAVRSILEMNDSRVVSQVESSSNTIETQIRTEVVPKLNEIERLLLYQGLNQDQPQPQAQVQDKGKGKAKATSNAGESPRKGRSKLAEVTQGRASGESEEGASRHPTDDFRDSSDSAVVDPNPMSLDTNPVILEMLSTIESQVGALCKVVIEGQIPDIGGPNDNPRSSADVTAAAFGDANGGLVDQEALARFGEMRKEMLTFPDALTDTNSRMQRLIEALATKDHAAVASGSSSNGVSASSEESRSGSKARENRERWESNVSEMMASYHERLRNLDTRLQNVDTGVQRMDAGFGDWRRSHQLSLSTFLRYMYMVHKRTESVDTRIHKALEEIKDQTKIDPDQLSQLLDSMRTEIMGVLTSLSGTTASQLNQSSETLEHAEHQHLATEPTDQSTEAEGEPQASGSGTTEAGAMSSQPGSRALGIPGPRITPESPVPAPAPTLATTLSSNNEAAGAIEDAEARSTAHVEEQSNPDVLIKSFAETLDFVKDGVASMIQNYASLAASMAQLTASLPSDPAVGDTAASAPATSATTPLVTAAATPPATGATTPLAIGAVTTEDVDVVDATTEGTVTSTAASASPTPTAASEAPEPPPRERSETHQTRTSHTQGARTRSRAPTSSRNALGDDASASAISENVSTTGDAGEEITDGSAITKEFVNEIEDMNRRLDNFMRTVTDATGRLSVGHNSLRDEFLREIQRVIAAIHTAPEMNEGRIRNLEAESQARLNENDMLRRQAAMTDQERSTAFERIAMIPNLMESLEGLNTHQSDQVGAVMREVLEIRANTEVLKSTVVACHQDVRNVLEGSKQDSSVIGAVRDRVETFSSQQGAASGDVSLTAQVTEVLKTATEIGTVVGDVRTIGEQSRTQQDALERKMDELFRQQQESFELCGKKHDESWQAWFDKHTAEVDNIEKWHEKHDADMRDLDQWRHFHRGELEDWHRRHSEQLSGIQECRCRCCAPGRGSKAEVEEGSRAPSAVGSTNTCDGTNPPKQRVRELFNEFLEEAMPEPENAVTGSLPKIVDLEPAPSAEDPSSELGVAHSQREVGVSSEPAQRGMDESVPNPHVQRIGESASYHGAPVIPPGRSAALPQELYSLLRPYFILEPTATQDREVVESEELLGLMQRVMDRDREIDALRADATLMGEKVDRLEENLAEKDQRLKDAWADLSSLCRAGIAVNADGPAPASAEAAAEPSVPTGHPLPETSSNNNASGSEIDSTTTSPVVTIRKLMEESAVYLRQALEELKAQKGELHHEIRRLREERDELRKYIPRAETKAPRKAASFEDKGKSKASGDEDKSTLKVPGEGDKRKPASEESEEIEEVILAEADVVDDGEYAEEVVSARQRGDRGRSRGVGVGSSKSFSTYRKRQSYQGRSRSRGPGSSSRSNGGDMSMKKVPQLGADISICRNGVHAETLLSSKALLTPELFEGGRSDGVNEPWSLSCNFKVRMVDHP